MVPSSGREDLAACFAPHVELLREYLTANGVPFGKDTEIPALAERLGASPLFHEDMASLLKTIIYTESKSLTRMELLDLLCLAVGGPVDPSGSKPVPSAVRGLLVFVNEVLLSMQRPSFAEPEPITEEEPEPHHVPERDDVVDPGAPELSFSTRMRDEPALGAAVEPQTEARSSQLSWAASQVELAEPEIRLQHEAPASRQAHLAVQAVEVSPGLSNRTPLRQAAWLAGATLAGFWLGAKVMQRPVPLQEPGTDRGPAPEGASEPSAEALEHAADVSRSRPGNSLEQTSGRHLV